MRGEEYFRQLWDGKRTGSADRIFMALLTLLSLVYGLILRLRVLAYESGYCAPAACRVRLSRWVT